MAVRVGINGFGRIGRSVFRLLLAEKDIRVAAIYDRTDARTLAHLLKYDSIHGVLKNEVAVRNSAIVVDGNEVPVTTSSDPAQSRWYELGVDLVLESTGVFRRRDHCMRHIQAGAKKVLLSSPPQDAVDATIVVGVNHEMLRPTDAVVSSACSTTNCLAPVARVLHEKFGITRGFLTTLHACTNDQRVLDMPHNDLRRARAGAVSIIPTSGGAGYTVGRVLPALRGKLDGIAMRVPVIDGSAVDLVAELRTAAGPDEINAAMKEASEGALKGILMYCEDPIVSCDVIGNPASSVFDALSTMTLGDNLVKVVSWFDNEWGYANRCVDLLKLMAGV